MHGCSKEERTQILMTTTLLPCPFCGKQSTCHYQPTGYGHWVTKCTACKVSLTADTEQEAAEKWNRRTTPPDATEHAVSNIQVCHLPYQDAPFVFGHRGGKSVWLKRDGSWSEMDGDPECSLTIGQWEPPPSDASGDTSPSDAGKAGESEPGGALKGMKSR